MMCPNLVRTVFMFEYPLVLTVFICTKSNAPQVTMWGWSLCLSGPHQSLRSGSCPPRAGPTSTSTRCAWTAASRASPPPTPRTLVTWPGPSGRRRRVARQVCCPGEWRSARPSIWRRTPARWCVTRSSIRPRTPMMVSWTDTCALPCLAALEFRVFNYGSGAWVTVDTFSLDSRKCNALRETRNCRALFLVALEFSTLKWVHPNKGWPSWGEDSAW